MFTCATEAGICLLEFTGGRMLETELKDLCKRLDAVILRGRILIEISFSLNLRNIFQVSGRSFQLSCIHRAQILGKVFGCNCKKFHTVKPVATNSRPQL